MRLITVFAASGRQGLAQVRQLTRSGYAVRAISRAADPFYGEKFENTEVLSADLDDPESVARAVAGADGVFLNCPLMSSDIGVTRIETVGRAAVAAGVARVILHVPLWLPEDAVEDEWYENGRQEALAMLRSHPSATVLGGVLFMDNLLTDWAFPDIVTKGLYRYPHNPELGCNWISLDDVAKLMIAALEKPELAGRYFTIGGPERLRPREVAAILTEVTGHEVNFKPYTPREYGYKMADVFALPPGDARDWTVRRVEDFYVFNNFSPSQPFAVDMAEVLREMPVQMETMREWVGRQVWEITDAPRPPGG